MKRSVSCTVAGREQALRLVEGVREAGFSREVVSLLMPEPAAAREPSHGPQTQAAENAPLGGTTGGALDWLGRLGVLTVPGFGALVTAGRPLTASSSVPAATAGIAGALAALGVPEIEARRYETRIRSGRPVVSVHCDDFEQARRARVVLERFGARDIATSDDGRIERPAPASDTVLREIYEGGEPPLA